MKAFNSSWLTTFGDLLTLLLCFVMVVLYKNSINSAQKSQSIQAVSSQQESFPFGSEASGKTIASNLMSEYRQQALSFTAKDFDQNSRILNSEGLNKIKTLSPDEVQKFEFRICNFDQNYAESLFKQIISEKTARSHELVLGQQGCRTSQADSRRQGSSSGIFLTAWFLNNTTDNG